ncbi:MAG: diguanylate cyclase [PVC group bacterium]|nr:diguanylate cyclase [PVC group bacterium]
MRFNSFKNHFLLRSGIALLVQTLLLLGLPSLSAARQETEMLAPSVRLESSDFQETLEKMASFSPSQNKQIPDINLTFGMKTEEYPHTPSFLSRILLQWQKKIKKPGTPVDSSIMNKMLEGAKFSVIKIELYNGEKVTDNTDLFKEVEKECKSILRDSDELFAGKDSFTIVLPDADYQQANDLVLPRLKKKFNPIQEEHKVRITAGVAMYPYDGTSVEELQKQVEAALKLARERSPNATRPAKLALQSFKSLLPLLIETFVAELKSEKGNYNTIRTLSNKIKKQTPLLEKDSETIRKIIKLVSRKVNASNKIKEIIKEIENNSIQETESPEKKNLKMITLLNAAEETCREAINKKNDEIIWLIYQYVRYIGELAVEPFKHNILERLAGSHMFEKEVSPIMRLIKQYPDLKVLHELADDYLKGRLAGAALSQNYNVIENYYKTKIFMKASTGDNEHYFNRADGLHFDHERRTIRITNKLEDTSWGGGLFEIPDAVKLKLSSDKKEGVFVKIKVGKISEGDKIALTLHYPPFAEDKYIRVQEDISWQDLQLQDGIITINLSYLMYLFGLPGDQPGCYALQLLAVGERGAMVEIEQFQFLSTPISKPIESHHNFWPNILNGESVPAHELADMDMFFDAMATCDKAEQKSDYRTIAQKIREIGIVGKDLFRQVGYENAYNHYKFLASRAEKKLTKETTQPSPMEILTDSAI